MEIIEQDNSENKKNKDLILFEKDEFSFIDYNSINKSKKIF